METTKPLACTLVSFALLATLSAQGPRPSNGPLVGLPVSVTTLPGTKNLAGATLSTRTLYHKKAGVGAPVPISGAWQPNTPDYSFQTLFNSGGSSTYDVQLGATSAGLDYIATDSTGRYASVSTGWNVLAFTVSSSTVGRPGSVVAQEAAGNDGAAADVFTYGLNGSDLPGVYVGSVQRALDSTEIDAFFPGDTSNPPAKGQIGTLDFGMTYYSLDAAVRAQLQGISPTSEAKFYFTVAKNSLLATPSSWWGTTMRSGATVFVRSWSTATKTWSSPGIFLTYTSLGLIASDAIDGLAVNPEGTKVLFSIVKSATSSPVSQLRYARISGTGVSVFDYEYNGVMATPIGNELGIETDGDLKEICIVDPKIYSWINQTAQPPFGQYLFSGPSVPPTSALFPVSLGAAIYRSYDATRAPTIDSWMTGWAPNGPVGLAFFLIEIPPTNSLQFVTIQVPRSSSNRIPGDPVHMELLLPSPYDKAFQKTTMRAIWVALSGSGVGSIGTSHMLSISL